MRRATRDGDGRRRQRAVVAAAMACGLVLTAVACDASGSPGASTGSALMPGTTASSGGTSVPAPAVASTRWIGDDIGASVATPLITATSVDGRLAVLVAAGDDEGSPSLGPRRLELVQYGSSGELLGSTVLATRVPAWASRVAGLGLAYDTHGSVVAVFPRPRSETPPDPTGIRSPETDPADLVVMTVEADSFKVGGGQDAGTAEVLDAPGDATVGVGHDGTVAALKTSDGEATLRAFGADGELRWQTTWPAADAGPSYVLSPGGRVTVLEDQVVASRATGDGSELYAMELVALDSADGGERWTAAVGAATTLLAPLAGGVVAGGPGTDGAVLESFDETGAQQWTNQARPSYVSPVLISAGVPGVVVLDAEGTDTSEFVVATFDDSVIEVLGSFGLAGALGGGTSVVGVAGSPEGPITVVGDDLGPGAFTATSETPRSGFVMRFADADVAANELAATVTCGRGC